MLILKVLFGACLLGIFVLGIMGIKRFHKWFGVDPNVPSNTEGATMLNKSQFILVWLLSLKLCAMMFFML